MLVVELELEVVVELAVELVELVLLLDEELRLSADEMALYADCAVVMSPEAIDEKRVITS